MTDAVHEHGALAGIELAYNGHRRAEFIFACAVACAAFDGRGGRLGL